jgi:hypothetical protein
LTPANLICCNSSNTCAPAFVGGYFDNEVEFLKCANGSNVLSLAI